MQRLHFDEMPLQGCYQGLREQGHAVLGAFPIAHDDVSVGKIKVLHAEPQAFHEAEPSAV